jgi:hypothetical protein
MGADEWNDMMPHRIRVRSAPTLNEYGRKVFSGLYREYRCLFDDTLTVYRGSGGEAVTVSRTAYVNPDGDSITMDDEISFTDGTSRPVVSIQTNYDVDGSIHNVVVQFS